MRPQGSYPPDPIRFDASKDSPSLYVFIRYLKDYFQNLPLKSLWFTLLFVAVLVTLNYAIGIEDRIRALRPLSLSLAGFFTFYSFVFFGAWAIQPPVTFPTTSDRRIFLFLLLLAPIYFALKMIHWDLSFLIPGNWHYPWNAYTLILLQLPAKLILLLLMLSACWNIGRSDRTPVGSDKQTVWASFGIATKGFSPFSYLLLLLFLVPLVALASTRPDFLHTYPKFKNITFLGNYTHPLWPWRLLYELSYGLDFVSIELFFRGFLVIGLARWAGSKAILPMAAFYCTIHFGKPCGECISSFAGGLALGVIAWRTRSILGGLMVHLGLAWMMELGGWLGNL